jgi:hypothetical protein
MYGEMGNDDRTEMQRNFQNSHNRFIFLTTANVGWTDLDLTGANHAIVTQIISVFIEQWQAFTQVVWLGQNRAPHTG